MAKKLFLNRERERAIPVVRAPAIIREEHDSGMPSTCRNNSESETTKELPFLILAETSKSFPKFNTTGRSLIIKFKLPGQEREPTTYLKECITELTNYLVDDVPDRDLVGVRIGNTENLQGKVLGISFRRRDQMKPDLIWAVLSTVIQSNARFGLTDRLEVHLDHVRIPVGNGKSAEKTKWRSLDIVSSIKRSIFAVKAAFMWLAHTLIIAIAHVNGDSKYAS